MKSAFRCARCGETWDPSIDNGWGTHEEGDGYGPQARCPNIVQDPRTKAGQVCGGALIGQQVADATELRPTKPITPRARR